MKYEDRLKLEEAAKRISLKLTDEEFCENFIWIVNKESKRIKFKFNTVQKQIEYKINELRSKGIPPRILILKARQEGVSTYVQAKILRATSQYKDINALIIAHRDDSTSSIFEKSKFMLNNLPEFIKPLQRASNAKELIFDTPTGKIADDNKEGLNSKTKVQTSGSEGIGRSDTYTIVHISEYGLWEQSENKSPKKQLAGIMQSVPDTLDSLVIIESTAKGYNDFKDLWDGACLGKNAWTPLFFAWHAHDEYIVINDISYDNVTEKWAKIELKKQCNLNDYEMNKILPYILSISNTYNLNKGRVLWWISTFKNKCDSDFDMMRQENPSFPEEAFLTSGSPFFDLDQVIARKNYVKEKIKPIKQGYFEYKEAIVDNQNTLIDISFVEDEKGEIKIYKLPNNNKSYPYVIGGDPAGAGSDNLCGQVIDNVTLEQVAVYKKSIDEDLFANQLFCLGRYYNNALIGIETNTSTYPMKRLRDLYYTNLYYRKETDDKVTGKIKKELGFWTSVKTRPFILSNIKKILREDINIINDIDTLDEMLTFIKNDKGKYEAQTGKHDDLIISLAIAYYIRDQHVDYVFSEEKKDSRVEQFYKDKANEINYTGYESYY